MSAKDVGKQLRSAREQLGASLEEAAESTRIRQYYLEALEKGEFGELPSPVQVRGFIRAYAKYLRIDAEKLFAKLESHAKEVADHTGDGPKSPGRASDATQTQAIYTEIGKQLQQQRKPLELSLEEVELHTHIPEHYVERLESGQLDEFPSPTQARGMLSNYADFLGMDTQAVMDRYAEALQLGRVARNPAPRRIYVPRHSNLRIPDTLRSLLSPDLLFGALIGLVLIGFVVFSIGRINTARTAADAATEVAALGVQAQAASPTTQASSTPVPPQNTVNQPAETANPDAEEATQVEVIAPNPGAVVVQVLANQRSYMRIIVDGEVAFDGRTAPGGSYNFNGNGQIALLTGNGAALRVIANGEDLGLIGIYGEVVELVFNTQGVTTPTVTPTPTIDPNAATETSTPIETGTPTETPTVDQVTPTP